MFSGVKLTNYEMETICAFTTPPNTTIRDKQRKLAKKLAYFYSRKADTLSFSFTNQTTTLVEKRARKATFLQNDRKSKKYFDRANDLGANLTETVAAPSPTRGLHINKIIPIDSSYVYTEMGRTNLARIWLIRLNNFLKTLGKAFLPKFFGIFGLFFIIPLTFEVIDIIDELFVRPASDIELGKNKLSIAWGRLWNVLTVEGRPRRIINNVLWLGINTATLILTGGTSAILLVVCGFSFDVISNIIDGFRALAKDFLFYKKMTKRLDELQREQSTLSADTQTNAQRLTQLEGYINAIILQKQALKRQMIQNGTTNLISSLCFASILVGYILTVIPPTSGIGMVMVITAASAFAVTNYWTAFNVYALLQKGWALSKTFGAYLNEKIKGRKQRYYLSLTPSSTPVPSQPSSQPSSQLPSRESTVDLEVDNNGTELEPVKPSDPSKVSFNQVNLLKGLTDAQGTSNVGSTSGSNSSSTITSPLRFKFSNLKSNEDAHGERSPQPRRLVTAY